MLKVKIWVHASGWAAGGYENALYFKTHDQINDWHKKHPHVDVLSIEEVSEEAFAEDYIC